MKSKNPYNIIPDEPSKNFKKPFSKDYEDDWAHYDKNYDMMMTIFFGGRDSSPQKTVEKSNSNFGTSTGGSSQKKKYYRNKSERKKTLKRDAGDLNSGLNQEQRDFINANNGNNVPKDCEVSHTEPLYTKKTIEGKRALDTSNNMKTLLKVEHRNRHKPCGGTYHRWPR